MRKSGLFAGAVSFLLICGLQTTCGQSLAVRAGTVIFDRPEFDSLVLVEFPFALDRSEFEFFKPDTLSTGFYARIFAQVNLYDSLGVAVDSTNTYFSAVVEDSVEARSENFSLFNSLVLPARPGTYSALLTVIDAVSKREGAFKYPSFTLAPPVRDRLAIGGLSLAYRARYEGENLAKQSGVDRNGYRVLCNPDGLFATTDTAVFVYAELYNLDYRQDNPDRFTLHLAVLDSSGNLFRVLGTRNRPKSGKSAVVVESFDIGGWPVGSYVLEMKLTDSMTAREVAREIPFSVIDPAAFAFVNDPCSAAGVDLATQLDIVHFLLTPDEQSALERLSDVGKCSFLKQYWQDKDPDPQTPVNEYFRKIYERYLYANSYYSVEEGKTDGWKTDRGRILIVYGPCDRHEDQIHPTGDYPYQVWWYDQSKVDAVFVFIDDRGFGNFRLVHSTMPGEIYNDDWDEAIRSGFLEIE